MYVRVNDDYGRSSAWSPVRRLSPLKAGIFNGMSIAATGSSVFVAVSAMWPWRATMWTSRDHGSRWAGRRIGTTGVDDGSTALAAHHSLVVFAWTKGHLGDLVGVMAKVSKDGGRHWSATHAVGVGKSQAPSAAAIDGRVALAGEYYSDSHTDPPPAWVQEWRHGKWRPVRVVYPPDGSASAPDVQLRGARGIGLAYATRLPEWDGGAWSVVWQTSADGGRTWTDRFEVETAQVPPRSGYRRMSLTAVWRPSGTVHILSSLIREYPRYESSIVLRSRS